MRTYKELVESMEKYYTYCSNVGNFGYESFDKVVNEINSLVIRLYRWFRDNELSDIDANKCAEAFAKVLGRYDLMKEIKDCHELRITEEEQTAINAQTSEDGKVASGDEEMAGHTKELLMSAYTKRTRVFDFFMYKKNIDKLIEFLQFYLLQNYLIFTDFFSQTP